MKVISFFSGAGGMDLGFALAGHEIIWSNDFDKDAVETYNNNIGKYFNHKSIHCDIVELLNKSKEEINNIIPNGDIFIGGFPCQGFSIANVNRSMDDSRNFLYLELLKALSVKQPPYFLFENVKGLENMNKGQTINMILDDLEVAGTKKSKFFQGDGPGYEVVYNVLNAYNYGVPENRERVIILGIRKDIKNSHLKKNIINSNAKGDRKRLIIPTTHSAKSEIVNLQKPHEIVNSLFNAFQNGKIDYKYNKNFNTNGLFKIATIRDAISDLPYNFEKDNSVIFNHDGSRCKVKISNRVGNRKTDWEKHAPTIMGRGSGTGGPLIPPHPEQHRRLSVREVARIQTFPDNFVFSGSSSSAYRQIGNAVPVLMAYNIALQFLE